MGSTALVMGNLGPGDRLPLTSGVSRGEVADGFHVLDLLFNV